MQSSKFQGFFFWRLQLRCYYAPFIKKNWLWMDRRHAYESCKKNIVEKKRLKSMSNEWSKLTIQEKIFKKTLIHIYLFKGK